ncbi:hypothetical protein [Methylovulum miyakonense]|uniref:hypothetical protein n=1 Tax=Methylovulum miyakonense TaxID=645578 RepID=UPI00036AB31C|nr:hypothetical protein [Methylovulum miyakonense]
MRGLPNHDLFEDLGDTIDKPPKTPKKRGRKPKPKPIEEKTGVIGGTGGTASNGGASNGNTAKSEGVGGVTVIDLDAAIDPREKATPNVHLLDRDDKKKSQATLLIELGQKNRLFHCPNMDGYALIGDCQAVMALRSRDFREHLSHAFFKLTGKGCNANALTDALATLESIAKFNNPQHDVYMRVANLDKSLYLDTGCPDWRVIEVTADGWRTLDRSPVKFFRKRGAMALPEPSTHGDITLLYKYINVEAAQLPLVVGWLLCALAGVKPYPILILQGEQGTGKSTTSRVLRSLVDPSTVPLRSPPKDPRDLLVSAGNNHVVVLDNLSGLSPELSDCLCRLSTGGGIDLRALFTDNEQVLIDIQRPVLINGIDDVATRPDLAERSIIINQPVIGGSDRKGELEFWKAFETAKPLILGALLDALVAGLNHRDSVKLPYKPRMADVAQWVTACEQGLESVGSFMAAHEKNQNEAVELGLESSPIGSAIMTLVSERERWLGKPTELMVALADIAGDSQTRSKAWPQSPKGLSNAIKRLMPSLRRVGISIEESRTMTARQYTIVNTGFYASYPSYPSCDDHSPQAARPTAMTDRIESMTDRPVMTDSMTDRKQPQATDGVGYDTYDGYDAYKPTLHVFDDDKGVI